MMPLSLFDQVVRISYVYLGPAADRFVSRQISNHLHKKPDQLKTADLTELIDWIRLAMGFLTEDQSLIGEYIKRLETLERKQHVKTKRIIKAQPAKPLKQTLVAHAKAD